MSNVQHELRQRLVPRAETPFLPAAEMETVQETVWFNPTDKDVILKLYIGVSPARSEAARLNFRKMSPMQQKEFRSGTRTFIIRKGERRAIHSDFDIAIQQTHCMESECVARPMYCHDSEHHHMVTGGYGPQLVNESVQHRPIVHSALIEAAALEEASIKAAKELLNQRQVAETALMVAQSNIEKAEAMRAATVATEARINADAKVAAESKEAHTTAPNAGKKGQ